MSFNFCVSDFLQSSPLVGGTVCCRIMIILLWEGELQAGYFVPSA